MVNKWNSAGEGGRATTQLELAPDYPDSEESLSTHLIWMHN
jgi:hypothetical protein